MLNMRSIFMSWTVSYRVITSTWILSGWIQQKYFSSISLKPLLFILLSSLCSISCLNLGNIVSSFSISSKSTRIQRNAILIWDLILSVSFLMINSVLISINMLLLCLGIVSFLLLRSLRLKIVKISSVKWVIGRSGNWSKLVWVAEIVFCLMKVTNFLWTNIRCWVMLREVWYGIWNHGAKLINC